MCHYITVQNNKTNLTKYNTNRTVNTKSGYTHTVTRVMHLKIQGMISLLT